MTQLDNSAASNNDAATLSGGEIPPAAADTEGASATPPTGESSADTPPERKPDAGLQKAINRLTRQRGEAERRADRLAAELEDVKKHLDRVAKPKADLKPEDFPNYDAYARAVARQEGAAGAQAQIEANNRSLTEQEATKAAAQAQEAFIREAARAGKAVGIDFEDAWDTLKQADMVSPAVANFLYDSDFPAHLAHWLAENPDELDRVSRLSPAKAFKELAKVEQQFAVKPKPNATKAPPPPPTVGGRAGSTTQKNPDDMNMEEYIAWRRAGNS